MSLQFFSDQCVPVEITDTLRQHGHQVALLREVLPIRSLDPAADPPVGFGRTAAFPDGGAAIGYQGLDLP